MVESLNSWDSLQQIFHQHLGSRNLINECMYAQSQTKLLSDIK